MSIKVKGSYPKLERTITGLHTFDLAVGNPTTGEMGLPRRCMVEIYGYAHSGKSTLAYYLASQVNPEGTIALGSIEGYDIDYVLGVLERSGFDGTLVLINDVDAKGKHKNHSEILQELADTSIEQDAIGIFDSVSMYASNNEQEGDIGEAHMGRRAKDIGQFCRRVERNLRHGEEGRKNQFVINHLYPNLGSPGHTTAGGKVLEGTVAVKVWIKRKESGFVEGYDDFYAEGKITKLRYGGMGRSFGVFFLANQGAHRGMTAVFDCFRLGLATRNPGGWVKIGDNKSNEGRLSELLASARAGDDTPFEPFYKALKEAGSGKEQ